MVSEQGRAVSCFRRVSLHEEGRLQGAAVRNGEGHRPAVKVLLGAAAAMNMANTCSETQLYGAAQYSDMI